MRSHLQRFDNGQWTTVGSTKLTSKGIAKFQFKIWNPHQFRVDLASTTSVAPITDEAFSAPVTVKPMNMADFGKAVVADAAAHKGAKYVFGTAGPSTFDCSGLVKYVFAKYGIDLPHHADDMKRYGKRISAKDARPGDLVFVFTGNVRPPRRHLRRQRHLVGGAAHRFVRPAREDLDQAHRVPPHQPRHDLGLTLAATANNGARPHWSRPCRQ